MKKQQDIYFQADPPDEEGEGGVQVIERQKTKLPKRYKVLLHNDDYTTMEFVIHVMMKFFGKSYEESHSLMLKVHHEGHAICGIYTFEVAETKMTKVIQLAKEKLFGSHD